MGLMQNNLSISVLKGLLILFALILGLPDTDWILSKILFLLVRNLMGRDHYHHYQSNLKMYIKHINIFLKHG